MTRLRPYIICSLATLYYVYEFYLRVMPSAMTNELMRDFNMTARGLGVITALFYYGYVPMQVPVGLLFDRLGPKVLLTGATLICAIATLVFGLTDSTILAGLARLFIGFASAFAFVGTLVLVSRWFAPRYFAFIIGLVQFMGCVGAIGGEAPIAVIVSHIGWRPTMFGSAAVGILLAVLLWTQIQSHPEKDPSLRDDHEVMASLMKVIKNPQMWAIGIYAFTCWAPITIFAALWGVPFLKLLYQGTTADAATAMAWVWIGIGIGSPLFGWWSNKINNRNVTLATGSLIALITSLLILYVPHISWPVMYVILFFFGVSASGQVVSFGVVQDITPPDVAGTAVGFNNMAVVASGILLQPLIGFILHYLWGGSMANGVPVYNLESYRIALAVMPLCSILGLVASLGMIKETHCKPQF